MTFSSNSFYTYIHEIGFAVVDLSGRPVSPTTARLSSRLQPKSDGFLLQSVVLRFLPGEFHSWMLIYLFINENLSLCYQFTNEWMKTVSISIVALEMITEPGQRFRGAIAVATWTGPARFEAVAVTEPELVTVTEPESFEHPNCDVGRLNDGDCTSHPLTQFVAAANAATACRRKRDIDLIEPTPVVTNTRFARQSEIESSQEEPEVNLASSNVGATDGRALSGVVTATSTITSFSVFTTKITKTVTFLPAGRNSILNCMPPGFIRC